MMTFVRKHWRWPVRLVAVLLIVFAALVVYFRFYLLGPGLRVGNPEWCQAHSSRAFWQETQSSIRRIGWGHNDGFAAAKYGDKKFMEELLMSNMKPDDQLSCFSGHEELALQGITNQDFGCDAEAWIAWWEKNKHKSQEEWIADGFAANGIAVHNPPAKADIEPLLALLGRYSIEEEEEENEDQEREWTEEEIAEDREEAAHGDGESGYMGYNAYRWLRDSEFFDPMTYALEEVTESTSDEVKAGLLKYARYERIAPKRDGVGILLFGRPAEDDDFAKPWLLSPEGKATVYALIAVPAILGIVLIAVSMRKRKRVEDDEMEKSEALAS